MFKNRSYGFYGERHLSYARSDWHAGQYERAALDYQQAIECFLKEALAQVGCKDTDLMRTRELLRLDAKVFDHLSDTERTTLRALSKAYFELRYPTESDIDALFDDLGHPSNHLLRDADSLATKCRKAAIACSKCS